MDFEAGEKAPGNSNGRDAIFHLPDFRTNVKWLLRYRTLAVKELLNFHTTRVRSYMDVKLPLLDSTVTLRTKTFWKEFENGEWERGCIQCAMDVARNGDVLFDVGASAGAYTILFSKLVGPKGLICAFEPDPKAFDFLQDNIRMNRLRNVRAENIALTDSAGTVTFLAPRLGEGNSSSVYAESWWKKRFTARATTIDLYCRLNRIQPRGLKIDVEGAECSVINGALEVLEKCHPWLLLEFHGYAMSDRVKTDCWRLITNRAKRVVSLGPESARLPPYYGHFFVEF